MEMSKRVSKVKMLDSKAGPGVYPYYWKDYLDFFTSQSTAMVMLRRSVHLIKPVFLDKLD